MSSPSLAHPLTSLRVCVAADAEAAAEVAATRILTLLREKPTAALGVATGSTPSPVYRALARSLQSEPLDLSRARAFALDEYVGIDPRAPQSYRSVIDAEVTEPLGFDRRLVAVPDGSSADLDAAASAYEAGIDAIGGVDLQILGIGHNGHIGFNEPGSPHDSPTRVVDLAEETREANARFFDGDIDRVPRQAMTQGIGTILKARSIVLLAFGSGKAEAVARALEGPIAEASPASALRRHADVTILLDKAAASSLS
ncbi:glucosamine-6-phosphate deaminase [Agreia sp. VKM Ac-1783]|uniref:glucosamine-6-phosphate deaminase n=1 Tax=Agreia sp. VKM Ac-1783 TaxID=1938889 RepID=UPI000A2AC896|nr:glucosamine-6-phosphate deaminase [Agreia sp. VKM Ac-1783]SMQ75343.1 glucosamine-6-phosphate deaminase [Agreia sp. VKM Ac-1783]